MQDASEAQLQLEQLQLQLELQPATSTAELLGRHQQQQQPPQGRLPAKAVMLFNRASSLHRQGAHRAAVADLDEALALAPLRADFYQVRVRLGAGVRVSVHANPNLTPTPTLTLTPRGWT